MQTITRTKNSVLNQLRSISSTDNLLKEAGLDFTVVQKPAFYQGDLNPQTGKAKPVEVPNFTLNVRSDTNEVLGYGSAGLEAVQPQDNLEVIEALRREFGVGVSRAASWKNGARSIFQVELGKVSILGDEYGRNAFLLDALDCSSQHTVVFGFHRFFCMNQIPAMKKGENAAWSQRCRHTSSIHAKVKNTVNAIQKFLIEGEKALKEEANRMVNISMDEAGFENLVKHLLDWPEELEEVGTRKYNNLLEARGGLFRALRADDLRNFEGTAWAAFQAVADYVDHKSVRNTENAELNRTIRSVQGDPLLLQARKFIYA